MISMRLVALLCCACGVFAQTAQLTGTVTDTSGAAVPGTRITLLNTDTGLQFETTANLTAIYTFPLLASGRYEVKATQGGFRAFAREGIVMETGTTRTIDIVLEIGEVSESINVTAGAPLLESETSTVGQLIERTTVASMPVGSRRGASLVRLAGTVILSQQEAGGGEQLPFFSVAGGRSRSQMWNLDGTSIQNSAIGVAQLGLNPPAESLQEIKLESNNLSAEYGRTGGGFVTMTTRSGTNQLHGAIYEFLRNDALDARTFFARGKAPLRYNIFGGSIGGPIIKNKTFFFFNYEGGRRRDGLTFASDEVPHSNEINGDFSARTDLTILDPLSGQPFPGNRIPSSRIDPVGQALARLYPAPNRPGNDVTRRPSDNYLANVSDSLNQDFYTLRVDHSFGENDRVFGRYMKSPNDLLRQPRFANSFADPRAAIVRNDHDAFTMGYVHGFSSTTLNDFRFNYGNRYNATLSLGKDSNQNGVLGIKGVDPSFFATVRPAGLTQLGTDNQERVVAPILTIQAIDTLTRIAGKHQLRVGFDFRYSKLTDESNTLAGGRLVFGDRATGDGLAALLLGWTTSADLLDNDPIVPRSNYYSAFFQDDWKVTSRLTLNLGVRWEMDTPRWEERNQQNGFAFDPINPVSGTRGIVTFAGVDGRSKYSHDFDTNNIAPRFGFALRPVQDLVLRGGYGLFFYQPYLSSVGTSMTAGFSKLASFSSADGGFTPPFLLSQGLPAPPARERIGPGFGASPVGQAPRLSPEYLQQNHENGLSQQWNFSIQKQVAGNSAVEIGYLANVAHNLGGQPVNINMIALVNGRGPATQDQRLRPFPQFNNVTLLYPPWGNSTYHALTAKLEKRYSNGLSFLTNYTWSKFIDDIQAESELAAQEDYPGYTHIELRSLDKALSGNDVRHRWMSSFVYELPVGSGKRLDLGSRFTNFLLGGWGLGGIIELRAGAPFGVIEQTNRTNTFSHSQRPNLARNPTIDSDRTRAEYLSQYFDTSAFQDPGVGVFGNSPRTICCGPGFIGVDMSAYKWLPVTERYKVEFRTDAYNVINRPNFGMPGTVRGRGDFGRISSILPGSAGRQLQLSLRVEF
jgi:hypothetical protein